MPRRKKKKSNIGKIILILILLLIVGGIAGAFFWFTSMLQPVNEGKEEVFVIEEGQSFDSVLENLEKDGMIKSKEAASFYVKINDEFSYYAGNFEIDDSMSVEEILAFLSNVENAKKDSITITIPEGKWAKEIAEIVAGKYDFTEQEIIALWNDANYIKELAKDYEFLNVKDLDNPEYRVKLEGYLFPDTYSLDKDATLDDITRTMLNRFNDMYQEYKDDFDNSKYSIHEIVTLASIVQFESGYESDMPTIAGVFYNRLNSDMMLQSSVTVCYALYDDFNDPTDCEVMVDVESPYNTYENAGIPIGPILNAGKAAFDAVLHPEDTDYLFFLADIHGDGKVYYSKTIEEHEEKMRELGLEL